MQTTSHKMKATNYMVEQEKNEIAIKLLSLKDEDIIRSIKIVVDDLTSARTKRTSKSKYNSEIDAAVKRVRNGKSISNDKVMDEMDSW